MRSGLDRPEAGHDPRLQRRRRARAGDRAARSTAARSSPSRTEEKDGYTAVQLGVGTAKAKNVTKADARPLRQGQGRAEDEAGRVPRRRGRAARGRRRADAPSHFVPGQIVDVTGTTIGKGFAGVMKRWNFGGLRATPRRVGLAPLATARPATARIPGRTFKGKKMAGHLGDERVTTQNLKVVADRRRARPDPGQGRGARRRGRLRARHATPSKRAPPEGCAVPGRPAQGAAPRPGAAAPASRRRAEDEP